MKRIVLLACAMLTLPGVLAAQNQNTVRELTQLNDAYDQAWVRGDVAALERVMADDFTSTSTDGRFRSKAQSLDALRSGDLKITSAKSDDVVVRMYGNTAVVTGRWIGSGQYKGESWNANERYTSVLVNRNGRWQYVADHASEIKQQQ